LAEEDRTTDRRVHSDEGDVGALTNALDTAISIAWLAATLIAVSAGVVLAIVDQSFIEGLTLSLAGMAALAGGNRIWRDPVEAEMAAAERGEHVDMPADPVHLRILRGLERGGVALIALVLAAVDVLVLDSWAIAILIAVVASSVALTLASR
jgi:hypothetical protein